MTFDQVSLLVILLVLLVSFAWGRWRYDLLAIAALFVAALLGVVPKSEMFIGFGHPATITVALVLVLSHGLTKSGAIEGVVRILQPVADKPLLHISVLTIFAAFLSMFMNNVGALALLIPIAIQSTTKAGRSPATVLMPLSFASILGGLVTLIGTPPNIIIASYREDLTGEPFRMFDFAPVGGGVAVVGVLFMLLVGWRLVKVRKRTAGVEFFEIEEYLFEVKVDADSSVLDESVAEVEEQLAKQSLVLIALVHKTKKYAVAPRRHQLTEGDVLLLQGSQTEIDKFVSSRRLLLLGADSTRREVLHSEDSQVLEVVISPESHILGKSVEQVRFTRSHRINLLAVSRQGRPYRDRLRLFRFRVGDVLLLHGDIDNLKEAINKIDAYPLAERALDFGKRRLALPALLTFASAVALAGFGVLPIELALGIATVIVVVMNVVPIRELYSGIDWPIIVLLGAMIPIGKALQDTGATALLTDGLLRMTDGLSPVIILALILVITMTVSDVLNNAATAILMAPIATGIAQGLGCNVDPFLMAVAVGASCAFLTPIGHQNNALVMGPGGYQFRDYWPVGLPLEIVIVVVAVPLIIAVWPL